MDMHTHLQADAPVSPASAPAVAPSLSPTGTTRSPWVRKFDAKKGKHYYANRQTKRSQWTVQMRVVSVVRAHTRVYASLPTLISQDMRTPLVVQAPTEGWRDGDAKVLLFSCQKKREGASSILPDPSLTVCFC